MTNTDKILDELYHTQMELFTTYAGHRQTLAEISAPQEVVAMLEKEFNLVMDRLEQAIEHAKIMNAQP